MVRNFLLAATMLAPITVLPGIVAAQPVTGLYIGGAGGGNFLQHETTQTTIVFQSVRSYSTPRTFYNAGYVGLADIGYGLGNGLRLELEGNYRYNDVQHSQRTNEQKYGAMANVLFDLDVGSPYVFPYIGGGLGYAEVEQHNYGSHRSDGSFAYQAIAGLSFPIPPVVGLSLTAEYRFYSLAGDRFATNFVSGDPRNPASVHETTTDNYNHSLMLGLRYAFNVAPPPVAAAPAPGTPQINEARTYLVFFDWDRADLTDRARQIVAAAAQQTTRIQVTRIEVSGHTDTTGTAAYNQGLSIRRAQNVAAELVRLGVPRASITTQGFGFSKPLVATGPGTREPQNRRVEIVLR